ncbi:MAG: cobalamin-dependent protein [Pseudomonadota bacterium]
MARSKISGPKGQAPVTDSMFEAGTAAFRKVVDRSLGRDKSKSDADTHFAALSSASLSEVLSQDPVNSVIEGEIIPRLMMAHARNDTDADAPAALADHAHKVSIQISDFAKLPLQLDAGDLLQHIESFLDQGIDFETICVDVLAPAARKLGDMWCDDECDFVDVTMGLWRLQEVMRSVSARVPGATSRNVIASTALFAPIPGDPHAFGAQMIDEIFAKAGWLSEVIVKPQRRELLDHLSKKPFDLVGLTITRDSPISAITSLIKTMRGVSANPAVSIIIGGNLVNANPGLVDEVGADGTAVDARQALRLAEQLVEASGNKALTQR